MAMAIIGASSHRADGVYATKPLTNRPLGSRNEGTRQRMCIFLTLSSGLANEDSLTLSRVQHNRSEQLHPSHRRNLLSEVTAAVSDLRPSPPSRACETESPPISEQPPFGRSVLYRPNVKSA
jgi:hypothetical protein